MRSMRSDWGADILKGRVVTLGSYSCLLRTFEIRFWNANHLSIYVNNSFSRIDSIAGDEKFKSSLGKQGGQLCTWVVHELKRMKFGGQKNIIAAS